MKFLLRIILLPLVPLLAGSLAQAVTTGDAAAPPPAAQTRVFPTTPHARPDGRKWRLGYYDGGNYSEYPRTLRAVVEGLQKLGWLTLPAIPADLDSHQMWQFIAANAKSSTLQFVDDAWWQAGNFDAAQRPVMRAAIEQRIKDKHDIDLIIAMGTWAGQDMATLGAPVPTIVGSTSDPVGSGIIKSDQDSGMDNLFARVQPDRYQRQVRLFHQIVPFKTLGLVYEDSPEGRTYAAVSAVEQVAKEDNFKIVSCNAPATNIDAAQATLNAVDCYRKLSTQVDAMYITVQRGLTPDAVTQVADILRQAKVPSFAMLGSDQVRAGLLMSLAQASYSYVGLFYAETIARIFNGAKPRQLSQIWVDPAKIAINLATARAIGFDPPVDILLAADEVYQ